MNAMMLNRYNLQTLDMAGLTSSAAEACQAALQRVAEGRKLKNHRARF